VLEATDKEGFVCSMTMFGESVFTLTKREQLRDLLGIFDEKGKGGEIIVSDVDFEGARLLK
jgi:predicted sugar kinase